ncbi:MAG: hypothetical protein J0L97_09890 [Alphaproteobacteria bacterium]|nr:hypothetical protein [Alphaproteobacteria bacterium]
MPAGISIHDRESQMALPSQFSFRWKKALFDCRLFQPEAQAIILNLAATFGHLPFTAENSMLRRELIEILRKGGGMLDNMGLRIHGGSQLQLWVQKPLGSEKVSVMDAITHATTEALRCTPYIEACIETLHARPFLVRKAR